MWAETILRDFWFLPRSITSTSLEKSIERSLEETVIPYYSLFSANFLILLEKIVKRLIWMASNIPGRKESTTVSSKDKAINCRQSWAVSSLRMKADSKR